MSKSIIYSVLLHLILALYLIFVFNLSKKHHKQNERLHVKIEIKDLGLVTLQDLDLQQKDQQSTNIEQSNKATLSEDVKKNEEVKEKEKEKEKEKPLPLPIKKPAPEKKAPPKKKINPKENLDSKKISKADLAENDIVQNPQSKNQIESKDVVEPLQNMENKSQEQLIDNNSLAQDEKLTKKETLQKRIKEKEFQLAQKSISGLNLSNREKFNLYSQIKSCFQRSVIDNERKSEEKILVKINIDKNGYITSDIGDLEEMINYKEEENKERFANSVKNAKRALQICSPLRGLPLDKYDIWKEIILEFSQEDINQE